MIYYDFPKRTLKATLRQNDKIVGEIMVDITTGEIISTDKVKSFESKVKKEKLKDRIDLWKQVDEQISSDKGTVAIQSINEKILNVDLIGQLASVWCAPASAQMVLKYKDYDYSQGEIATAMETDPITGTYLYKIPVGIEEVTDYQVDSWNEGLWWWSTLTDEIDNNHPFLTSGGGHTKAVRGYQEDTILIYQKYLYINDPWPVGFGEQYMENYYTDQMWDNKITLVN